MKEQPDLTRDAAALFRHLRESGCNLDRHKRWSFTFRADEIEPLEELGEFLDTRLREFFHVLLQESVDEVQSDGSLAEGPPLLRLEFVGTMDESMLDGLHKRLASLAVDHGVRYEGSGCHDEFPFDLDMFDAAIAAELPGGSDWDAS